MEDIRLIVDSSANMTTSEQDNLVVVPLTISFSGEDFLDDQNLKITDFLQKMQKNKEAGKTSCPSIKEWLSALEGSEKAIIVTMTSAMSGTYSSALQAKNIYLEKHPQAQIIVVDSRSAGPELTIIIEKIKKLLKQDLRWVDLEEEIAKVRTKTHLIFLLQSLHNLSLNGRVSPAVAKMAGMLHINIVGTADKAGKLEPLSKARGLKKALRECVKQIKTLNYQGGHLIIDYCENEDEAQKLKDLLLADFPDSQITLRPMRGLCSFYAEEGGLMVGFDE